MWQDQYSATWCSPALQAVYSKQAENLLVGKTKSYWTNNSRLLFLILYNQANTDITYDRAIFFFHKNGILETYAFSKKAQE
jgi:hypothetical protein